MGPRYHLNSETSLRAQPMRDMQAYPISFSYDGGNPGEVYWESRIPFGPQLRGYFQGPKPRVQTLCFPHEGLHQPPSLCVSEKHVLLLVNAFNHIQLHQL